MAGVFLTAPLENAYTFYPVSHENIDAVVVLGGGNYQNTPNLPLEEGTFKRLMYGIMLAKKYNLPLLFTGGHKDPVAVKQSVIELNQTLDINLTMPTQFKHTFALYLEEKSKNTHENALFSMELLRHETAKQPKIYLVTSAFHMPRAKMIFEKVGFSAIPAPTDFKAAYASHFNYLPSTSGLQLSYLALHEYLGYLRYLFKN